MWNNILYSGFNFNNNDKFLKHKFKLINAVLLIAIFASFFISFIFIFIGSKEAQTLVITLEIFYGLVNLALFLFLRTNKNNLKLVTYLGMFALYILQVIIMINLTEDSLREAWYFLTIIISFFLGGRKFGYIMLSIIFVTMLVYNFQPFIETNLNSVESVVPLVLLVLVAVVINLYERTNESYAQSLKETNILLENKIEELNQFNKNLENRVKKEVKKNRQQELQLFEQSKMVAMGEMIGNIAHQWRQPLSVISTISTGIKIQKKMDLLSEEAFDKNMDTINDNVQYLSKTIDDFRNFAKGDRSEKVFNLSDEIEIFLHLVEGSVTNNYIKMILDLDNSIEILGYPNELKQCFINIFNNTKDALKNCPETDRIVLIKSYIDEEKTTISFKDSAGGIPNGIIHKVFTPYFTTKHQSQGTGLGLSMTYKLIVDGMNGKIEVRNVNFNYENKNYKGAEFIITLFFDKEDK